MLVLMTMILSYDVCAKAYENQRIFVFPFGGGAAGRAETFKSAAPVSQSGVPEASQIFALILQNQEPQRTQVKVGDVQ